MIKLYLLLFREYFKIGVFAIGGGYAALPFLYYLQKQYNWFSIDELTNMIAVSNITPGPVGINMATYTGYSTAGIIGSIIATSAIVLAPFIFAIAIIKLFNKYKSLPIINDIFIGLRPAACALLTVIGVELLYKALSLNVNNFSIDYKAFALFILMIIPLSFMKKNPLLTIITGAFGGIIFNLF